MRSSKDEVMPPDKGKRRPPGLDRLRKERVQSTPGSGEDR